MLASIPLLILVVAAYNVLAFFTAGALDDNVLNMTMPSGATWQFSTGELLVVCGLILLFFEIFKATRTSNASIVDHILSTGLFVVCVVELLVVPQAATSTFFVITIMTLLDVIAGFTITISTARRDIGLERGTGL